MTEVIPLPYISQRNLANYEERFKEINLNEPFEEESPKRETVKSEKRKYTQDWRAYNLAQTNEKFMMLKILSEVVDSLGIRTYTKKTGRPPLELGEMIKCCCIKVFNEFSGRRTIPDLKIALALRYISRVPHFNSISNYMNNPQMTRFLLELIQLLALPLSSCEKRFAADATGFSTFNRDIWVKVRLHHQKHRDYKKLHIICGVNTNVIVSAKVTDGKAADSPHFKELLNGLAKNFDVIRDVSADAGYISRANAQAVEDIGAVPYIMPKKNSIARSKGYPAWKRMINMFFDNEAKFRLHYHQRSNVETTFAMIKRKFGTYIKSKQDTSMTNEILLKCVCHNIACLIQAVFELDLDIKWLK